MADGKRQAWSAAAALILAAVVFTAVYSGISQLAQASDNLRQVRAVNLQLAEQNQVLLNRIQRLRNDPQAIERACRQDMGLVRPGEVVYKAVGGADKTLPRP